MSDSYDTRYEAGYDAGHEAGYETGHEAGYDAGHEAGYDAGHEAGYDEAISEGNYDLDHFLRELHEWFKDLELASDDQLRDALYEKKKEVRDAIR